MAATPVRPVRFAVQSRQEAAFSMTDIWCQRPGRAWQKACTVPPTFGRKLSVAAKITPDVPSESRASPSWITPTPTAPAALSPPPPATGTRSMPQASASSARRRPVCSVPSTSLGMCAMSSPVAASMSGDQARAPTSTQRVPEASERSEAASPVILRRT